MPYEVITTISDIIAHIIYAMLYISITNFITGRLYFLIPCTFFIHLPLPLPSGSHQFVLYIYESGIFAHLFYSLDSTDEIKKAIYLNNDMTDYFFVEGQSSLSVAYQHSILTSPSYHLTPQLHSQAYTQEK